MIDQVSNCSASVAFQLIDILMDEPLPTSVFGDIEESSLPHNEAFYLVPAIVRGNITGN